MSAPSTDEQAVLAVEIVGEPAVGPAEVDTIMASAFALAGMPVSIVTRWVSGAVFRLDTDIADLSLPKHLARVLRTDLRAVVAMHVGAVDSATALRDARHVRQALSEAPVRGVVGIVSEAFLARAGSPAPDGALSIRSDGLRAWMWTTADESEWVPNKIVLSVAISPDGEGVVTGHNDGTVQSWDTATGEPAESAASSDPAPVHALAFVGDELVSGNDGLPHQWRRPSTENAAGDAITAIAADPAGEYVISGAADGQVSRWTISTGDVTVAVDRGGPPVHAIVVTEDDTVFVGGADGIRSLSGETSFLGHDATVRALVVSADGQQLVSGGDDQTIRTWNFHTGLQDSGQLTDSPVLSLAVTPDGRHIVSGHRNGAIHRWDAASTEPVGQLARLRNPVHALAVTPDGQMIVAGDHNGKLQRWRTDTGALVVGQYYLPERLADVVSDLESAEDRLGVGPDVHRIATVLAALSTKPPLSVALLGDWGAGKSSFMRQLRDRMDALTTSPAELAGRKAFVANLRQVTFNAWHYSDDHLWVGLIEHLFRELRAQPTAPADPGRVTELTARLAGEDAERRRLDRELGAVQRMDARGGRLGKVLAPLRSWPVFLAAVRGVWHGGWRLLVGLLLLAAGIAVIVVGQQVFGSVLAVLGPVVAVWSQVGRFVDSAREHLLARKAELDDDIRATTDELDELDPARRLDRLLMEITAEDRYASYRGLTGRIHHDLRRLSADLATARRRWEVDGAVGKPPLQRIVLYVDDLDRCTPERVVDVLQAVNLLLTMDLFMVVVAVDPRWLLRSLDTHHGALFSPGVGPVAYLDKIFHIPFALRPMGNHAVSFLHSLLPDAEPAPVVQARPVTSAPAPIGSKQVAETARAGVSAVQSLPTEPRAIGPAIAPAEGLRVTAAEREFLGRLTPLLTTPRAIKKLTNLYRLLRLSVPRGDLPDFLDGPYQAAALLLTALAGAPTETHALLETLATTPDGDIVDTFKAADTPLGARLTELILAIRKDLPVHTTTATYRRWATEVARFGFETYDLYTG